MRVIAGKARRLNLVTVEGPDTRPTTDRIKETLFNMLQGDVPGCRFLDLFSGSGAIGIEALSRGAESAVFVENNRKAADCIRRNLAFTRLESQARLLTMDVIQALQVQEGGDPFHIIFMDPPYGQDLEKQVLFYLKDSSLVSEHTLLLVEAERDTDFSYVTEWGYEILKSKEYKTNKHVFLRKRREA